MARVSVAVLDDMPVFGSVPIALELLGGGPERRLETESTGAIR